MEDPDIEADAEVLGDPVREVALASRRVEAVEDAHLVVVLRAAAYLVRRRVP